MRIRAQFSVQLKVERHIHVCRRTVASSKNISPLRRILASSIMEAIAIIS